MGIVAVLGKSKQIPYGKKIGRKEILRSIFAVIPICNCYLQKNLDLRIY